MLHDPENKSELTHLQKPSIANSVILNQNPQCCEDSNTGHHVNIPIPFAEPCSLPGFQQTFGQRNALRNQIAQYPNASSQMDCSSISHGRNVVSFYIGFQCKQQCICESDIATL
ncbi:hypothetical protein CEXT_672291 [Caerostris extrusa]|uniref:Uncharacterized protein n=1 Tax=Caerostris extrusa TaxID=172846 RepID=A0AAV4QAU4_CAEEX|nr:hypothetical protein CEXT_672291 [Caerostris extrusa]